MRRYVTPKKDANVWCPSGRWGPRRVRVTECWGVLRAEEVYTRLLRDNATRAKPGAHGSVGLKLPGWPEPRSIAWELRPNGVWRFGVLRSAASSVTSLPPASANCPSSRLILP